MTTVGNWSHEINGVFIGRPTKWGNPFRIGFDGTRDQVIHKYTLWIWEDTPARKNLRNTARRELRGKHLLCYCTPQMCHGHILASVAESAPE